MRQVLLESLDDRGAVGVRRSLRRVCRSKRPGVAAVGDQLPQQVAEGLARPACGRPI